MKCAHCEESGVEWAVGYVEEINTWLCKECKKLNLKKFEVMCVWQEMGSCFVLARDEESAAQKAIDDPLPDNGSYIDNSFEIESISVVRPKPFNYEGVRTGRFQTEKPNLANKPRGDKDDPVEPTR